MPARLCVLLAACLHLASARPLRSRIISRFAANSDEFVNPPSLCGRQQDAQQPPQQQWYCEQQLDHFAPLEGSFWAQRYFVNDTFFNRAGEKQGRPVFLCVGGETPLTADSVITGNYHCGNMMVMAARSNALVLSLEHRYYGASLPTPDFSTPNLRWLSSQQALADLAQFHTFAVRKYNLATSNRWVSFGGSYPGMMAAWSRLKFPNLIYAAVASSAPVQASLEMQGYNDVIGEALKLTSIGGSNECHTAVKESFAQVGEFLASEAGRTHLISQFNVCNTSRLSDVGDQMTFTELIAQGVYSQENDPASSSASSNLEIACGRFMTNATLGSPIQRLASLTSVEQNARCIDVSYDTQNIVPLQNRSTRSINALDVAWTYQTCTQFGFYQTCDPNTECPFTSRPWLNTLQSYLDICKRAYGIDASIPRRAVSFSNADTGGSTPVGSRVLWVNGQADPWHALSVLSPLPEMPAFIVPGASHHFWTHPPLPTDTTAVVQARERIAKQVDEWLSQSAVEVVSFVM